MNIISREQFFADRVAAKTLPSFRETFLAHMPTKQGHNYNPLYERFFDPIRLSVKKVLEIGVEAGTSLRMWADYFPNAEIHGFDIDPECRQHQTDRCVVHIGDQTDISSMGSLPGGFDIIIDDGLHSADSQIGSFAYLYKHKLNQRGIYVVEDVIQSPRVLRYFNDVSRFVNYWPSGVHGSQWSEINSFSNHLETDLQYTDDQKWLIQNTLGVSIFRHIIFVDKGRNPEDGQAHFRLQEPELWKQVNRVRQHFLSNSDFITTNDRYSSQTQESDSLE